MSCVPNESILKTLTKSRLCWYHVRLVFHLFALAALSYSNKPLTTINAVNNSLITQFNSHWQADQCLKVKLTFGSLNIWLTAIFIKWIPFQRRCIPSSLLWHAVSAVQSTCAWWSKEYRTKPGYIFQHTPQSTWHLDGHTIFAAFLWVVELFRVLEYRWRHFRTVPWSVCWRRP